MEITTITNLDELIAKFDRVRQQTEDLVAPLTPEDTVAQPVIEVSPPKWHMGHTTWFWEEFILSPYQPGYQRYHPRYAYLFNSYYEGAGERINRAYRGNMTRPTKQEILAYRQYVSEAMRAFLHNPPQPLSARERYILEVGLNHEQQHQELLLYDLKYILGHNPLFPAYLDAGYEAAPPGAADSAGYLEIEAGVYEVGYQGEGFHFDNETGRHRVFLEGYRLMDRLVTTGEFLAFVEAGGYQDYRHWLEEGWRWVETNQVDTPFYWFQVGGEWHQFTHHGLRPLDSNAPMTHVNYYEAQAFAKWKGMRLPTEHEWEVACQHVAPEIPAHANFMESGHYRPLPRQAGDYQFWGDAWEWTQSAYLPYPHYQAEEGTLGEYNGKFMVNQMVLRGGSCATPRDHIRATYRNFFHPHMQWLFSGFRLAAHT
jgi:ergothioneine biosynthesis protein EgtB